MADEKELDRKISDLTKTLENLGRSQKGIFEKLQHSLEEQERVAKKLSKVMEDLGETALKKLTKDIKDTAKETKFLTAEQIRLLDNTKDVTTASRELADAIEQQEKITEEASIAQHTYNQSIKAANKLRDPGKKQKALKLAETQYEVDLKNLGITKDEVDERIKSTVAFRELTDGIQEAAIKLNFFREYADKGWQSLKKFGIENATAAKALELSKRSVTQFIDELNKATAVGLQDSFMSIGWEAKNLLMSFDEFSDVIAKNRDIIRQLGGGTAGIKAFGATLEEASKGLAYMGKDGITATAKFMGSMKTMGITTKDMGEFRQAISDTQVEFGKMSFKYGDTAEQFNDLIESQMKGTNVQNQMINMNITQREQLRKEIMLRTENSKQIGLSNEQIVSFNQKLEDLNNPHKGTAEVVSQRINSGEMTKVALQSLANTQPENKELQDAVSKMKEITAAIEQGDTNKAKKLEDTYKDAFKIIGAARAAFATKVSTAGDYGASGIAQAEQEKKGGTIMDYISSKADASATASAQNLSMTDEESKRQDKLAKKQIENASVLTESTKTMRDVQQQYTAVMQTAIAGAFLAVTSAAGALTVSLWKFNAALKLAGSSLGKGLFGNNNSSVPGTPEVGSKGGKWGKYAGRAGGIVSAGMGLYEGYNSLADYNKGKITEKDRNEQLGGAAGGAAGGWAGAEAGAAIGSIGGPVGMLAGGAIGGALGYWGGSSIGKAGGSLIGSDKKNTDLNNNLNIDTQPNINNSVATAVSDKTTSKSTSVNPSLEELKKQTDILTQIAQNTYIAFKPSLDKSLIKGHPSIVANATPG